jgi:hypothetical protein
MYLLAALPAFCSVNCAPPSAEPATPAEHSAPSSRLAPLADAAKPPALPGEPAGDQMQVSVDQVKGGSIEYARALIAPSVTPMKECRTKAPTAVRVRITSENGEAALHVEPGSSLDGSIRRCVLEALSTIELPDPAPQGNAPMRPTGFSSLITVEW